MPSLSDLNFDQNSDDFHLQFLAINLNKDYSLKDEILINSSRFRGFFELLCLIFSKFENSFFKEKIGIEKHFFKGLLVSNPCFKFIILFDNSYLNLVSFLKNNELIIEEKFKEKNKRFIGTILLQPCAYKSNENFNFDSIIFFTSFTNKNFISNMFNKEFRFEFDCIITHKLLGDIKRIEDSNFSYKDSYRLFNLPIDNLFKIYKEAKEITKNKNELSFIFLSILFRATVDKILFSDDKDIKFFKTSTKNLHNFLKTKLNEIEAIKNSIISKEVRIYYENLIRSSSELIKSESINDLILLLKQHGSIKIPEEKLIINKIVALRESLKRIDMFYFSNYLNYYRKYFDAKVELILKHVKIKKRKIGSLKRFKYLIEIISYEEAIRRVNKNVGVIFSFRELFFEGEKRFNLLMNRKSIILLRFVLEMAHVDFDENIYSYFEEKLNFDIKEIEKDIKKINPRNLKEKLYEIFFEKHLFSLIKENVLEEKEILIKTIDLIQNVDNLEIEDLIDFLSSIDTDMSFEKYNKNYNSYPYYIYKGKIEFKEAYLYKFEQTMRHYTNNILYTDKHGPIITGSKSNKNKKYNTTRIIYEDDFSEFAGKLSNIFIKWLVDNGVTVYLISG